MFKIVKEEWPFEVNEEGVVRNRFTGYVYVKQEDKHGYHKISTTFKGIKIKQLVHRLVCFAFLENPENLPQVNHIDGDKQNNHLSNLEWCDGSRNQQHALELGLRKIQYAEDTSSANMTNDQVHEICRLIEQGYRNVDISKKLDVVRKSVSEIRIGKSWTSISKDYNLQIIRRGRLSENTVHIICKYLQQNLSVSEILNILNGYKNVTESVIRHIKNRNSYHDITCNYNY